MFFQGGSEILRLGNLSFINFYLKKSNIGRSQQSLTERLSDIGENWIFDYPLHKKRPVLVILVFI